MARSLRVEIVGDARSLERSFAKATKSTKSFGRNMQGVSRQASRSRRGISALGGVAGAFGVTMGSAAVIGGIRSAVDASKDLGESVNAVQVVFGKAAPKILKFSETASKIGLSARAFNEAVTPIGAALQNQGDSADVAAKKSIALGKRAADLASVYNTDLGTAIEAIQAGLRGEADPLEKFGVGLSDAKVTAKALALGLADTRSALTDQDKAQARYALLMQQSNKVAGDFKNTSGSLANAQRILRASVENLMSKLGTVLLPIITKLTVAGAKWLSNSKNQKTVLDTVKAAAAAVSSAVQALSAAFKALNAITGSTKNTFKLLLGLFVGFKALKLVSYIARMTAAMRAFGAASAAANAAGAGGALGGGAGKAGRFGRIGKLARIGIGATVAIPAGIELSKQIRKIPRWEETFRGLGGAAADAFGAGARGRRLQLAPAGARGPMAVNIEHFHSSAQNPKQMEAELARRHKQRAHARRGNR